MLRLSSRTKARRKYNICLAFDEISPRQYLKCLSLRLCGEKISISTLLAEIFKNLCNVNFNIINIKFD